MKRLLFILLFLSLSLSPLYATTYAVVDSISVSDTAVDSTFTQRWIGCSLWFLDCEGWIKFALSPNDTTGWSSKQWVKLIETQPMHFWPEEPYFSGGLYRLEYRCTTGTGALFITGLKMKNR